MRRIELIEKKLSNKIDCELFDEEMQNIREMVAISGNNTISSPTSMV